MRGKVLVLPTGCGKTRITPAYAGKSFCRFPLFVSSSDHPRLCGEKVQSTSDDAAKLGSPPPMRGKGVSNAVMIRDAGITPAYAGKSRRSCFLRLLL